MKPREQELIERLMVLTVKHTPTLDKDMVEIKDLIEEYYSTMRKDSDKENT